MAEKDQALPESLRKMGKDQTMAEKEHKAVKDRILADKDPQEIGTDRKALPKTEKV